MGREVHLQNVLQGSLGRREIPDLDVIDQLLLTLERIIIAGIGICLDAVPLNVLIGENLLLAHHQLIFHSLQRFLICLGNMLQAAVNPAD
ncbi:hypothetical protein D3C75_221780 [compost metagenome]